MIFLIIYQKGIKPEWQNPIKLAKGLDSILALGFDSLKSQTSPLRPLKLKGENSLVSLHLLNM